MPYIVDDFMLVCAGCAKAYEEPDSTVEYSHPANYPDGYTCDSCGTVCCRIGKDS